MLAKKQKPSAHGRQGTTLQEMLVVLAILASLAGTGWPAISRGLGKSELRSGAKQLRTELAQTRLKAIETGEAHYFRYQPATGAFEVGPVSALNSEEGTVEIRVDEDAEEPVLTAAEFELPTGVVFAQQAEETDSVFSDGLGDDIAIEETVADEVTLGEAEWTAPILFFPNGRTSSAQFVLQGADRHYIMVTLRGLTGSATVGDPFHREVEE